MVLVFLLVYQYISIVLMTKPDTFGLAGAAKRKLFEPLEASGNKIQVKLERGLTNRQAYRTYTYCVMGMRSLKR